MKLQNISLDNTIPELEAKFKEIKQLWETTTSDTMRAMYDDDLKEISRLLSIKKSNEIENPSLEYHRDKVVYNMRKKLWGI